MLGINFEVELDQVRRAEILRKAERARQEKYIDSPEPRPAVYGPLLARMGKVMANVGNNLQDRYGKTSEIAAPGTANYMTTG